jgi:predicted nucleotidyltransferase
MKTSLTHLSDYKQHELADIVKTITEHHPTVEMIILFGSFARGDWVEERADDGVHYKYRSDYDFLIITEKEYQAMKIEQDHVLYQSLRAISKTPISLIAHDINFVNRRLRKAQYLFTDIKQQGICLYDTNKFELVEPKELVAAERKRLAKN